ncbi:MAG: YqgE/AlgH family protein [Betaproteobacteria bacterium]|nr:YqgE/AlgH family protein [Betaproteobacteria bacterium]
MSYPAFLGGLALLLALAPGAGLAQDPEKANGIFLVAKPRLQDPNFSKTVVLVTQHRPNEPMGVIINRPTQLALSEVFPENANIRKRRDPLYFGGPVAPMTLVFVFQSAERPKEALKVLDDVYMSVSSGLLSELISRPKFPERFKVYAGYSGWAPGQLQNEIRRGDWYVINADTDTIFRMDAKSVWPELLKRASQRTTRAPDDEHSVLLAGRR